MAQAVYHYIKNYSNFGKIGISYEAIGNMIKETLKDVDNTTISKVSCEAKEGNFVANLSIKVNYGQNLNNVTNLIQEKVETALVNMCEIGNPKINVKVEGVVVK